MVSSMSSMAESGCPGCSEAAHAGLGDHHVQRHIPAPCGDAPDMLKLVREPDKTRAKPVSATTQEGEAAIVESAAHAETMTVIIEREQRYQHHIEVHGAEAAARCPCRLGDAEAVHQHARTAIDGSEEQPFTVQDGQPDLAVACLRAREYRCAIDFPAHRGVGADAPGTCHGCERPDASGDGK